MSLRDRLRSWQSTDNGLRRTEIRAYKFSFALKHSFWIASARNDNPFCVIRNDDSCHVRNDRSLRDHEFRKVKLAQLG